MFPDLTRDDVFRLETARLWLRWPRAADAAAVAKLAGEKEIAEMTAAIPHPYTQQDAAKWIFSARAGNAQGSNLSLIVARRGKPNDAIGAVGLHQTLPGVALLGYWIGRPYQGRGLGSEAVRALADIVFQLADLSEIRARTLVENEASRRLLARCGFSSHSQSRVDLPARGGVFWCEGFRLTREAWAADAARASIPARAPMATAN